jgi:hypothetical protein
MRLSLDEIIALILVLGSVAIICCMAFDAMLLRYGVIDG